MNQFVQRVLDTPKYEKLFSGLKLVALTGSAQIIIQGLSFISGILVLRLLSTQEYAFYTIANTMLGTMSILADGGITAGSMSEGGKVWKNRDKLGAVIATGMHLRKRFSLVSLLVAIPILIYLLKYHEASWLMTILIVASLIPAFFATVTDSLLEIVPKLSQDIVSLQKNGLAVSVGRLVMLSLTVFIFPFTAIAVLAAGIPRIWGNYRLKIIAAKTADLKKEVDPDIQKQILKVVKRVLPTSIFYCFSGQISIWIISVFGTTTALAQIGGLGRLAMLFTIFNVLINTLISPRFARLVEVRRLIINRFLVIQAFLFLLSLVIILSFYFFANQILWILGAEFKDLNKEVFIVGLGGCISLISTSTNQLLTGRGIVVPPFIFMAFTILIQIGLAFILPLNSVYGVLVYGALTTAAIYLFRILYFFITIRTNENH